MTALARDAVNAPQGFDRLAVASAQGVVDLKASICSNTPRRMETFIPSSILSLCTSSASISPFG
jgi:hypothetical protein